MFTGIIENLGKFEKKIDSTLLFLADQKFCKKIKTGTSIAINGVCLTAIKKAKKNSFLVEIMPETEQKTMLNKLKNKTIVNLELPATVTTFLSGHVVQGHVDGVGKIIDLESEGNSKILKISIEEKLLEYVVEKGSITINGISLTVVSVGKNFFTVAIIPFTWKNTMLSKVKIDDCLNIETDVLGKYLKKFINKQK